MARTMPKELKRTRPIPIRFRPHELEVVKEAAWSRLMTVAEFCRKSILDTVGESKVDEGAHEVRQRRTP